MKRLPPSAVFTLFVVRFLPAVFLIAALAFAHSLVVHLSSQPALYMMCWGFATATPSLSLYKVFGARTLLHVNPFPIIPSSSRFVFSSWLQTASRNSKVTFRPYNVLIYYFLIDICLKISSFEIFFCFIQVLKEILLKCFLIICKIKTKKIVSQ